MQHFLCYMSKHTTLSLHHGLGVLTVCFWNNGEHYKKTIKQMNNYQHADIKYDVGYLGSNLCLCGERLATNF